MSVSVGSFRMAKLVVLAGAFFAATAALPSGPALGQGQGKGQGQGQSSGLGKGLIRLPVGEPVHMTYVGEELWYNDGIPYMLEPDQIVDAGDVFEGIAIIDSITGVFSCQDYSHQLNSRELTVAFRFTVIEGAHEGETGDRIEFALCDGDYFRIYVGTGNTKNYDPFADDAWRRATDGKLWIAIEPGIPFESVNYIQTDGSTLNQTWTDLTTNQTRFNFLATDFPLEFDDECECDENGQLAHLYFPLESDGGEDGQVAQLYFENFINGLSSAFPDFTFGIRGNIYMEAGQNN